MPKLSHRFLAWYMVRNEQINLSQHDERKRALFGTINGRVLEIGPGTGVNLQYLPTDCEWIGIEPNPVMHAHLLKKAEDLGLPVSLHGCRLDSNLVPDESIDVVITTLVLCSVDSLSATLAEVLRVLKDGGRFLFLEHVVDKENALRRTVQRILPFTPWRFFSDGCNPGRDIGAAIRRAGFAQVHLEEYRQEGAGIICAINRPHVCGWAIKGDSAGGSRQTRKAECITE